MRANDMAILASILFKLLEIPEGTEEEKMEQWREKVNTIKDLGYENKVPNVK